MNELGQLQEQIRSFMKERDWEQFHTVKNLIMALTGEVGELNEVFQWMSDEDIKELSQEKRQRAMEEIADVFVYLLRICDSLEIDIIDAARQKMVLNAEKYPVSLSRGKSLKYSEL